MMMMMMIQFTVTSYKRCIRNNKDNNSTNQPTNKTIKMMMDIPLKKTKPSIAWEPTLLKKINLKIGWIKSKHSNAQDG